MAGTKRRAKPQTRTKPIRCRACGKPLKKTAAEALYPATNVDTGIGVCSEDCHRAFLAQESRARETERHESKRFIELLQHLKSRVEAAPEDVRTIAEALDRAVAYARSYMPLHDRYLRALDAYRGFEARKTRADLRAKRAARIMFGSEDYDGLIARDFEMLIAASGLPEADHRGALYWGRTWHEILNQKPTEDHRRKSPHVGADLELRNGCRKEDELTFPLSRLEAAAAIACAYNKSMEAINQALKRAKKKGLLTAKTLNTFERI